LREDNECAEKRRVTQDRGWKRNGAIKKYSTRIGERWGDYKQKPEKAAVQRSDFGGVPIVLEIGRKPEGSFGYCKGGSKVGAGENAIEGGEGRRAY